MNSIVALPIATAAPATASALPIYSNVSGGKAGEAVTQDAALVTASCELEILELALKGLHEKYGDDADSREDYAEINERWFEVVDLLASESSRCWRGIEAKAWALRQHLVLEDYETTAAIAASLANDIAKLGPMIAAA